MSKELVKQDISFLEYPLWFQNSRMAEKKEGGYVWRDREGFVYRAGYKPPVKVDRLFLLYLVLKSQNEGWKEEIELSRFQILNGCQTGTSSYWYRRLEDSLERWKMIGIKFEGTFYDGKEYLAMNFGIIDDWDIDKENKKLKIRFSSRWLQQQKNSEFFEEVDFQEFRSLRTALTSRLYEILIKTFHGRSTWKIDALKLAQKIPMHEKYVSDIVPKIKSAVRRIREQTSLHISLEEKKVKRGKAILIFRKQGEQQKFRKVSKEVESPKELIPQNIKLNELLQLIPQQERGKKTILKMISETLGEQGEEYVIRNIELTNKKAKTNYRGYLWKALQNDYAAENEPEPSQTKQDSREQFEPSSEEKTEEAPLPSLSDVFNVSSEKEWKFGDLVELVHEDWKDDARVLEVLLDAFEERDAEYIIWNILFTNKNPGRNYAVSLKYALKDNFGALYRKQLAETQRE